VLPAALEGFTGSVRLRVRVNDDGEVEEVRVIRSSGEEAADLAARRTVRRWEYSPAFRNGSAVPAEVEETVTFRGGNG
jgi:protein TonB